MYLSLFCFAQAAETVFSFFYFAKVPAIVTGDALGITWG